MKSLKFDSSYIVFFYIKIKYNLAIQSLCVDIKSIALLNEKIFEKLTSRLNHFDCEDLLLLVRYMSKIKPQGQGSFDKVKFVLQSMINIAERIKKPEFLHEIRMLYKFENWMALMININLIY